MLAFIVVFATTRPFLQTRSVTLVWDASPSPNVVGYVVYVGTASRRYEHTFDVGSRTSFVYTAGDGATEHFFAVAA